MSFQQLWTQLQFWWNFTKIPAAVVVLNVLVVIILEAAVGTSGWHSDADWETVKSYISDVRNTSLMHGLLFLVDTLVLFKFVEILQHQVQSLEEEEEEEEEENETEDDPQQQTVQTTLTETTLMHAHVSQRLDCLLERIDSADSTIFLLLLVLFGATAASLMAVALSGAAYYGYCMASLPEVLTARPNDRPYEIWTNYNERAGTVMGVVFLASMGVAGYWILRGRGEASGVTLPTLALLIPLFFEKVRQGSFYSILMVMSILVGLHVRRPAWLQRDILIWMLYTILATVSIVELVHNINPIPAHAWSYPGTVVFMWVVTQVAWDHPAIQIASWIGAALVAIMTLPTALGLFNSTDVWRPLLIGILLSGGLAALGYYDSLYRPLLVYYRRLCWRSGWGVVQRQVASSSESDDSRPLEP